jgi:hypothetical protein
LHPHTDQFPPVSQSDLEFIADRSPTAKSPYYGVYPEKGGWVAKAYKRRVGRTQPTPREAAKLLVGWWKARYGERWRAVWALRQTKGWAVVRVAGGVWARVELAGEGEVVLGVGADGRACRASEARGCRPFASVRDAGRGVAEWAGREWGEWWPAAVRRTWARGRSAGRTPVPLRGG